jgi:hypothetical protein
MGSSQLQSQPRRKRLKFAQSGCHLTIGTHETTESAGEQIFM